MARPARALAAAALCLCAAACAGVAAPASGPNPIAVDAAIGTAAVQVRRCYRSPKIASEGKQIGTRLRVKLAPDGSLSGLPLIVAQTSVTPRNRPYAGTMAEAASLAVIRCAPLRLPAELYPGWQELELSFSPRAMA